MMQFASSSAMDPKQLVEVIRLDQALSVVGRGVGVDEDRQLEGVPTADLLAAYAGTLVELRRRGVVRTGNAPVGDYAEWLVAGALDGTLATNTSAKSSDLTLPDGRRVQVKARLVGGTGKGQLQTSPFRSWNFDAAALVLLDSATYDVRLAVLAPVEAVRANARWRKHVNGDVVFIRPPLTTAHGVVDISQLVRTAATDKPRADTEEENTGRLAFRTMCHDRGHEGSQRPAGPRPQGRPVPGTEVGLDGAQAARRPSQ